MKTEIRFTVDLENPGEVKAAITMLQKLTTQEKDVKKTKEVINNPEPVEKTTETKTAVSSIKIEDIRALLAQKVETHRAAIKSMLTELGAANVTTLSVDNYQPFMDFLNGLK